MNYSKDIFSLGAILIILLIRVWFFINCSILPIYITLPFFLFFNMIAVSIKHNHIHISVFRMKITNIIFDQILNLLTGTSTSSVKIIHVINHHSHNNNELDWGQTSQSGKGRLLYSFIAYTIFTPFAFFKGKSDWVRKHVNHPLVRYMRLEMYIILSIYIILCFTDPIACILTVILPFIMLQAVLTSFNFLQHFECETGNEMNSSRNITGSLFNLLYFNVGYHTVHHLYPKLHWSKFPEVFDKIRNEIKKELNHQGFWSALRYVVFSKSRLN